jgi:hypothetical protein
MLQRYWKKGISFESHLNRIQEGVKIQTESESNLSSKYLLSIERAKKIIKNYKPDPKQEKKYSIKDYNGRILIIAEGWCGDCSQSIPVIKQFFGDKIPLKILYRDENPDLMKLFLTNGNEAVPIVIFLDDSCNIISHWGPRTKHGLKLLAKFKNDPESYPKEIFLKHLHEYYEENKGFDIVEEILEIL